MSAEQGECEMGIRHLFSMIFLTVSHRNHSRPFGLRVYVGLPTQTMSCLASASSLTPSCPENKLSSKYDVCTLWLLSMGLSTRVAGVLVGHTQILAVAYPL